MRLRWLDGMCAFDSRPVSPRVAEPRLGVIVKPSAATCELLDDGDRAELGDGVVGLSDIHILMRCTELSKLLYAWVRTVISHRNAANLLDIGRVHLHERGM